MDVKKVFDFNQTERSINDLVHGSIDIFEPISAIIDTPEFQRLRNIKQLSLCELVYPSANHSRFSHSLGVYYLVFQVAKHLLYKRPDKLNNRDVLCLSIAGLIHDIGHGPLSHLFDGPFITRVNPNSAWTHEQASKDMFEHLLSSNHDARNLLREYLEEDDYVFIQELIAPPKIFLNDQGDWMLKGRPIEKSFLYDIVSNKHDGLDLDKLDYFLRDSMLSGVSIAFSIHGFKRLMNHMDICYSDRHGFNRLAYSTKVRDDCDSILKARNKLYFSLYKHKTALAAAEQIVDVLVLADKHLYFTGSNGKSYRMSESITNMEIYSQLKDSVFEMIRTSQIVGLRPAQNLLEDLKHRRIYRFLGRLKFDKDSDAIDAGLQIKAFLVGKGLHDNEFIVTKEKIHSGLGVDVDPMSRICFFNVSGIVDSSPFSSSGVMKSYGIFLIFVYLKSYESRYELKEELKTFFKHNFPHAGS